MLLPVDSFCGLALPPLKPTPLGLSGRLMRGLRRGCECSVDAFVFVESDVDAAAAEAVPPLRRRYASAADEGAICLPLLGATAVVSGAPRRAPGGPKRLGVASFRPLTFPQLLPNCSVP